MAGVTWKESPLLTRGPISGRTIHATCPSFPYASCLCGHDVGRRRFRRDLRVSSIAELQARIDGPWPATSSSSTTASTPRAHITVNRQGTADQPIRIVAETVGGVEITGHPRLQREQPRRATSRSRASSSPTPRAGTPSPPARHHIRFTRNIFECTGEGAYLGGGRPRRAGRPQRVPQQEHARQHDRRARHGQPDRPARVDPPQLLPRLHQPGRERRGDASASASAASACRTASGSIEHNLFVRCTGENELISNKSSANTYRYNTIVDSPGGELTLRHGNDCLVYGNYFRNTAGMRIFGDRHQVFSNYLEAQHRHQHRQRRRRGGRRRRADQPRSARQLRDHVQHAREQHAQLLHERPHRRPGRHEHGLRQQHHPGGGARGRPQRRPTPAASGHGNIIWETAGAGAMPAGTIRRGRPAAGARRPTASSVPSRAARRSTARVGDYPAVVVDLDGQPRPARRTRARTRSRARRTWPNLLTPGKVLQLIDGSGDKQGRS